MSEREQSLCWLQLPSYQEGVNGNPFWKRITSPQASLFHTHLKVNRHMR